ncbi:MAG: hypothetical protein ACI4IF_02635 [Acutalibacteraceae bacterium]
MKKRYLKDVFAGALAGIIISAVEIFVFEIPYLHISDQYFELMFLGSVAIGCVVSVAYLLYKNYSVKSTLVRLFAMFVTYAVVSAICIFLGVVPLVSNLLNISMDSGSDNASGLITLMYLISVLSVNLITFIISLVVNYIKHLKMCRTKQ